MGQLLCDFSAAIRISKPQAGSFYFIATIRKGESDVEIQTSRLQRMNRNSTFISESLLSGDRYDSKPCRPCLDDFSRTYEKRAEKGSSIRRRSVKKQAVVGQPCEEIAPRILSFQRLTQSKVKFSCSGDIKGEENCHEKGPNTDSIPSDAIPATENNNGLKPFVNTRKQDVSVHVLHDIDASTFVTLQEIGIERVHVSETGKEDRFEKTCLVHAVATSTPISTEKDEGELSTTAQSDEVDDKVPQIEDTRKIPYRITDVPTSLLYSNGVNEEPNINDMDCCESDGGKNRVHRSNSFALADHLSTDDENGDKRSAITMKDENPILDPQRTHTFNVSSRIKEVQRVAPPISVSPLVDSSKKTKTCNVNNLVTSSDTTLLPLSDDDATAETENSIHSKKDDPVELTLNDAEEPITMQRTSLPLLFLRMWTQSTIALFWFLLRLPLLLVILTFKVTALTAAAYTVLYVCFADGGTQFQPWVYNAQWLNKPGIC